MGSKNQTLMSNKEAYIQISLNLRVLSSKMAHFLKEEHSTLNEKQPTDTETQDLGGDLH